MSGFPGPVERKDKPPATAETLGGLREDVQCRGRVWALESADLGLRSGSASETRLAACLCARLRNGPGRAVGRVRQDYACEVLKHGAENGA